MLSVRKKQSRRRQNFGHLENKWIVLYSILALSSLDVALVEEEKKTGLDALPLQEDIML